MCAGCVDAFFTSVYAAVQVTCNLEQQAAPAGSTLAVPVPDSIPTPVSGSLTVGIRPEHVRLTRGGEGLAEGTITLVEPVGAMTYVDIELGASTIKASTDPADDFQDGESVMVDFHRHRMHFFDPDSGDRLVK